MALNAQGWATLSLVKQPCGQLQLSHWKTENGFGWAVCSPSRSTLLATRYVCTPLPTCGENRSSREGSLWGDSLDAYRAAVSSQGVPLVRHGLVVSEF